MTQEKPCLDKNVIGGEKRSGGRKNPLRPLVTAIAGVGGGLPGRGVYEEAYLEAVRQLELRKWGKDKWSCPSIYWAAIEIGAVDLNRTTWNKIKSRWMHAMNNRMMTDKNKPVPVAVLRLSEKISAEQRDKNKKHVKTLLKGMLKRAV